MNAIIFNEIGNPQHVLKLAQVSLPDLGDNDVLLRMVTASINPGDFLFIQNLYPEPKKPVFPNQIAGNHGAGVIERVGKNVSLPVGTFVGFSYYNTWAEYAVVPQEWLIPLPASYPLEKASQLVNIVSAWDLLRKAQVKPGDWLALTAGHSTLSIMTAQFAKALGVHVISVVRQKESRYDLLSLGTTAVIEISKLKDNLADIVLDTTANQGIHGLIDHVGGPITGQLIQSMAFGGRVIVNGVMSEASYPIHNMDILMRGLEISSYVYRFFFDPPQPKDREDLPEMIRVSESASFHVPMSGFYALEDYAKAVSETIFQPALGKRIFKMSDL
ncbi:NADPH:quinone reductase [Chryseolinea serpens]|uniref:NADPH:quinone reductase n=1 Tax=Chryseolinea serpens TaxID=947013 RepID=A0A1M5XT02_9BACT|nr:zinc-binding dehydrogenase [Chryseolinea serpens]SHI02941.1 NADPH:quinone reductase [Chryseolinea serpens]